MTEEKNAGLPGGKATGDSLGQSPVGGPQLSAEHIATAKLFKALFRPVPLTDAENLPDPDYFPDTDDRPELTAEEHAEIQRDYEEWHGKRLSTRVAALIARWREETGGDDHGDAHDPAAAYLAGVDRCADELEALLQAQDADRSKG